MLTGPSPDGTITADRLTVVGTAGSVITQGVALAASTTYTASFFGAPVSGGNLIIVEVSVGGSFLIATCNVSTGAISGQAGLTVSSAASTFGFWRFTVTFTTPAAGSNSFNGMYVGAYGSGAPATVVDVWGADLRVGLPAPYSGLPAVSPGDWLSLVTSTGNQLVKVMNTVVADSSDLLTGVEIRHALRGSVASGSAVTIMQPTGLYVQRNPDQVLMPRGGRNLCPATSIDLVEVFA